MLISKEHGGLGFSAQAQSLILGKISSRSPDVVTIVMVPNSLGPGELIEKYGTPEQKEPLPAAARAGAGIPVLRADRPDLGFRRREHARRRLRDARHPRRPGDVGIRVILGQALHHARPQGDAARPRVPPLRSREHLLGKGEDVGITLAIIPTNHPGVNIGRRHLPCGAAFPNGPTWGKDVFIPIDWIIGGQAMAGQGWRMLMECLSAGRSISLPSSAAAGIKTMLRFSTAYGRIRRQFGLPIAAWKASRSRWRGWSRTPTSSRPAVR